MSDRSINRGRSVKHSKFFYGWVIVTVCTLMMAITYGLMYSYSVFFKPLADYFNWDRASVSAVYSVSLIIRGAIAIGVGWLADRYGSAKLMVFCGVMIALGLILSSQVKTLWQFFITYALIEAVGLSGTFGIATALTSRWFINNRGLALGIVSSGVGLGTLLIVPGAERLINAFNWSQAFIICGAAAGITMTTTAFFLRSPSPQTLLSSKDIAGELNQPTARIDDNAEAKVTLWKAIRNPKMIVLLAAVCLFFFCTQMITVHLVNYATDVGITPLIAASFISIIGVVSIAGRLFTGTGADRIGINNTYILTRVFLIIAFIWLMFTRSLGSFYVFAIIFGFSYGGEVPQIPLFVSKFFGTRSMAALVGVTLFIANIGGALGPWVAGKIFDMNQSYHWAFIAGIIAGVISLIFALVLKKQCREIDEKLA